MKRFFKLSLFLLAFQMEIRVRASEGLLQSPSGCLKAFDACSLKAIETSGQVSSAMQGQIFLQKGAVMQRQSADQWIFIEGLVWFKDGSGNVKSLFADLTWSHGDFWLESEEDRVVIRNISSDLKVTLRDNKVLMVPEGFEFWVAGMNSKGQSEFGMVRPIDSVKHVKDWGQLYPGTKEEFKKELAVLKKSWKSLTDLSSNIYERSAKRQIASIEAEERAKKDKEQQAQLERKRLKEIFFNRTFNR